MIVANVTSSNPHKGTFAYAFLDHSTGKVILLKESIICGKSLWSSSLVKNRNVNNEYSFLSLQEKGEGRLELIQDSNWMNSNIALILLNGYRSLNNQWISVSNSSSSDSISDSNSSNFDSISINNAKSLSIPFDDSDFMREKELKRKDKKEMKKQYKYHKRHNNNNNNFYNNNNNHQDSFDVEMNEKGDESLNGKEEESSENNNNKSLRGRRLNVEREMDKVELELIERGANGMEWILIIDGDQCLYHLNLLSRIIEDLEETHKKEFSEKIQIISFQNEFNQRKNSLQLISNEKNWSEHYLFQFQLNVSVKNAVDCEISMLLGRLDLLLKEFPKIGIALVTSDKFASHLTERFARKGRPCEVLSGSNNMGLFLSKKLPEWAQSFDQSERIKEEAKTWKEMKKMERKEWKYRMKTNDKETISVRDLQRELAVEDLASNLKFKITPGKVLPIDSIGPLLPGRLKHWRGLVKEEGFAERIGCQLIQDSEGRLCFQSLEKPMKGIDCLACQEFGWNHGTGDICIQIYIEGLITLVKKNEKATRLNSLGKEIPLPFDIRKMGGWFAIVNLNCVKEKGIVMEEIFPNIQKKKFEIYLDESPNT